MEQWSAPVQPTYATRGADNPLLPGGFVGDPIIDVDQPYTYYGDASTTDNARSWSPNPRIVPVFSALMPDGKILYWDWLVSGVMDNSGEHNQYPSTRILLWDPANPSAPGERLDVVGANLFCGGFSHLPNGDLLVAGGNLGQQMAGLEHTWVYHWRTKTWERSQDMDRPRWYPSVRQPGERRIADHGRRPAGREPRQPVQPAGQGIPGGLHLQLHLADDAAVGPGESGRPPSRSHQPAVRPRRPDAAVVAHLPVRLPVARWPRALRRRRAEHAC